MGLILVLFIASLSIAGSAAYFSVLGLAAMFSAAYWPVVVMGGSLELGKLVAASFVYRTWQSTGVVMKTYLISAILLLMLITSLGIFGFLSKGYGDSTQMLQQVQYTTQAKQLEVDQVNERLEQINRIIEAVPNNYVTKRIELQREYKKEVDALEAKRAALRKEMANLQHQKMEADAHVGPVLYVAEMFGVSAQDAVKFFILALIAVFDPMAVVLTLATNHAIEQYQLKRSQRLADRREHELAMAHEKYAHSAPDEAEAERASHETLSHSGGPVTAQIGNSTADEPQPDMSAEPAQNVVTQQAQPLKLETPVPSSVSQRATRRDPTVAEMNAVLQQTPARKPQVKVGRTDEAPQPITPTGPVVEGEALTVSGIRVPMAVVVTLSKSDQELLMGIDRGIQATALASKLGMSDVNLRKRGLFLAERLNASGYAIDPKTMFS